MWSSGRQAPPTPRLSVISYVNGLYGMRPLGSFSCLTPSDYTSNRQTRVGCRLCYMTLKVAVERTESHGDPPMSITRDRHVAKGASSSYSRHFLFPLLLVDLCVCVCVGNATWRGICSEPDTVHHPSFFFFFPDPGFPCWDLWLSDYTWLAGQ